MGGGGGTHGVEMEVNSSLTDLLCLSLQKTAPEVAKQLEEFIGKLKDCLEVKFPFTVVSTGACMVEV